MQARCTVLMPPTWWRCQLFWPLAVSTPISLVVSVRQPSQKLQGQAPNRGCLPMRMRVYQICLNLNPKLALGLKCSHIARVFTPAVHSLGVLTPDLDCDSNKPCTWGVRPANPEQAPEVPHLAPVGGLRCYACCAAYRLAVLRHVALANADVLPADLIVSLWAPAKAVERLSTCSLSIDACARFTVNTSTERSRDYWGLHPRSASA